MTTATLVAGDRTMTEVRPLRSLEELVDRLMAALLSEQPQTEPATETLSVAKSVHEPHQARWAYAEWTDLVRRRFADRNALVYSRSRPVKWCKSASSC